MYELLDKLEHSVIALVTTFSLILFLLKVVIHEFRDVRKDAGLDARRAPRRRKEAAPPRTRLRLVYPSKENEPELYRCVAPPSAPTASPSQPLRRSESPWSPEQHHHLRVG